MRKTLVMEATQASRNYWEQILASTGMDWQTLSLSLEIIEARLARAAAKYRVCLPPGCPNLGRRLFDQYPTAIILMPGPLSNDEVLLVLPTHFSARPLSQVFEL